MQRCLSFLFLISFIIPRSYALTYFDVQPIKKLLDSHDSVKVKVLYKDSDLDLSRFRVKAYCSECSAFVFDDSKIKWIPSFNIWLDMPPLKNELYIKLTLKFENNAYVWLELQDIQTGRIYETPKKLVWSRNIFNEYLHKINSISNARIKE